MAKFDAVYVTGYLEKEYGFKFREDHSMTQVAYETYDKEKNIAIRIMDGTFQLFKTDKPVKYVSFGSVEARKQWKGGFCKTMEDILRIMELIGYPVRKEKKQKKESFEQMTLF